MSKFHNPYHFVPVKEIDHGEHCLDVEQFKNRELGEHSHAIYHKGKYNGRIICRLKVQDAMFIGASSSRLDKNELAQTEHFELEKGKPAIPASTLRGLISSIVETASNSALRVLDDQILSYRKEMDESLSAIGMIKTEKDDKTGQVVYKLLPLTMPTLKETSKDSGLFTFSSNIKNSIEAQTKEIQAYEVMFPEPRLKIYIGLYDENDELKNPKTPNNLDIIKDKKSFPISGKIKLSIDSEQKFEDKNHILNERKNKFLNIKTIPTKTGKYRYVIGQEREPSKYAKSTLGLFRILGKAGRDMPDNKKHELLIPYPPEAENWETFPILPEAIERFHQLADERTSKDATLPYELLGTQRNKASDTLTKEFAKKGMKNGEHALRLKDGDLVYFRPTTMKDDKTVVAEVSFSSIWRGRVEDENKQKSSVHDFFAKIDKDLLPFNSERSKITPAELLFGFVEHQGEKQDKAGLALAGKVQVSFGKVVSKAENSYYGKEVALKILDSPKLPCPNMYFRHKNPAYIKKANLKLGEHKPQGRKMYLHHNDISKETPPWKTLKPKDNMEQKTQIKPVKAGTEFFFHIDFNNLTDWELGLLCYALRPTEEFRHKLGMGKSIGLGTVCIDPVGLFLLDREKRYDVDNVFTSERYHQVYKEIELPKELYPKEAKIPNSENALSWQFYRDLFSEKMSCNIKNTLELLGNPSKVTEPVHTPLKENQINAEDKTYEWFGINDNKKTQKEQRQWLEPLDENSTEMPTLKRNGSPK